MHSRAVSRFSVESFLSQGTDELPRETLLCFRKNLVSRIVTDSSKFLRLPVNFFCLAGSKKFVADIFCVPEKVGYQETFEIIKRVSRFSVGNFLSHRTENIREGLLMWFWDFWLSEEFLNRRGIVVGCSDKISSRKFVVSHYRKTS